MENILNFKFDPTFAIVAETILALDGETEDDSGVDYKALYFYCFNGISDILESLYLTLDELDVAALTATKEMIMYRLKELQKKAEDLFVELPRLA